MEALDRIRQAMREKLILSLNQDDQERAQTMSWEKIHHTFCDKTKKVLTPLEKNTPSYSLRERDVSCFITCKCGFQKKEYHKYYTPSVCSSYYNQYP